MLFAFYENGSSVFLHKFFTENKPEAGSLFVGCTSCAIRRSFIEQHFQYLWLHAYSVISHFYHKHILLVLRTYFNKPPLIGELNGVGYEISNHEVNCI